MLGDGRACAYKRDIDCETAKQIIEEVTNDPYLTFENRLNPRHESTCILAQGLTDQPPLGGFIKLKDGDTVLLIQPHAASRDATEFDLDSFKQCAFKVIQQVPVFMIEP
jgi:hypothetical protein